MSTEGKPTVDLMSMQSACHSQMSRASTAEDFFVTTSNQPVMIPLPIELCFEIYELLSPVDLLCLGLASKRQLELLQAWRIKTSWRAKRHVLNFPVSGGFTPGIAFTTCFRAGRVHQGNYKKYWEDNKPKKKSLEGWLRSSNDWKVCEMCLAFLRPVYRRRQKHWRGLAKRATKWGEVCYRCAIIHESSKDFFVDIIWIHDFVSKALPRVSDGADDEDEDGER